MLLQGYTVIPEPSVSIGWVFSSKSHLFLKNAVEKTNSFVKLSLQRKNRLNYSVEKSFFNLSGRHQNSPQSMSMKYEYHLVRRSFKTKRLARSCFMNTGSVSPFSHLKLAGC
jgi:hypothetical protein